MQIDRNRNWIAFFMRGILGAILTTFLAGFFLAPKSENFSLRINSGFLLYFFIVCLPFTIPSVLGLGWIVLWVQEKKERSFGIFLRILIGVMSGLLIGCVFGSIRYYLRYEKYEVIWGSETHLFYTAYFGSFGFILGVAAGIIGTASKRTSN